MLLSMTGFGEARRQTAGLTALVEVRTINNRHFKLSFRATEGYGGLESDVEAAVREIVRRGTVQVNLRIDRQTSPDDFRINVSVLESYRAQLDTYSAAVQLRRTRSAWRRCCSCRGSSTRRVEQASTRAKIGR